MKRRLTLAILLTVAASLVLTGGVTLLLARLNAREEAEADARRQVEATAALIDLGRSAVGDRIPIVDQLQAIEPRLRVRAIALLIIDADNTLITDLSSDLPAGMELSDLNLVMLRRGRTVSGGQGGQVYAAAPINQTSTPDNPQQGPFGVVLITREADALLGPPARWFMWASGLTVLVAGLVAWRLGRRFGEPVVEATDATRKIAGGDLEARVPVYHDRGDELTDLGNSINTMAQNLQRSRGLEQQFLMSVSHDLRTPLTSIRGYAEAIADGAAPDDKRAAAVILHEAQRLERLVGDLLELARLDAQSFRLDSHPVELVSLVRRSAEGFSPDASAAGIAIDTTELERAVSVWALADQDRLAQIIANLVENALKFANHLIRLTVRADGITTVIAVSDDGPGIAPEDLPHVFERLYVARHQPVRKESGSGLGLAIVHELVTAMDGSVTARRNEPTGTIIEVRLPATAPPSVSSF